jgi:hypothetical protein
MRPLGDGTGSTVKIANLAREACRGDSVVASEKTSIHADGDSHHG